MSDTHGPVLLRVRAALDQAQESARRARHLAMIRASLRLRWIDAYERDDLAVCHALEERLSELRVQYEHAEQDHEEAVVLLRREYGQHRHPRH